VDKAQAYVVLVVPKQHVKTIKSALERHNLFDKTGRITSDAREESTAVQTNILTESNTPTSSSGETRNNDSTVGNSPQESGRFMEQRMRIPTTIPYPFVGDELDEVLNRPDTSSLKQKILSETALTHLHQAISIHYHLSPTYKTAPAQRNPVIKALKEALDALPANLLSDMDLTSSALTSSFPDTHSIYKPMLLLPQKAFSSPPWTLFQSTHPPSSPAFQSLLAHIAAATHTTHIALQSPIPDHLPTTTTPQEPTHENILRRPQNIAPVYGSFGPAPTPHSQSTPTHSDFAAALWVSTTQNGIHQTWAPRYTMFSRGNIREKTRILHHASVTAHSSSGVTALDLYAGIGYFAFSYKRGGGSSIQRLLCWELNPWSVEGLRRGAQRNGWSSRVVTSSDMPASRAEWEGFATQLQQEDDDGARTDFLIFQMHNDTAPDIIRHLRSVLPPVRHVNLGLLPSSRGAWGAAVEALDRGGGGWIRAHENVGVGELDVVTRGVEREFQDYADAGGGGGDDGDGALRRRVRVEHVERVKTYAPGVLHVVFDVHVE
ncbi:hypothetical protein P153DRAFT_261071, partial [Dothidotthia symphoricarpi CBS 119687]